MALNLRQMEAFRAVMLTGSISEAAGQLFKTQPAVSMLITALEEDIGFQLFERRKKRLYPTPEAKYLYKEVEGIFARINDVSHTIKDIQNKQHGYMRIGCMPGPSVHFMPELIADFLESHPKVQVSMQTRTSEGVREWIASSQYDIGLAEVSRIEESVVQEAYPLECLCALPAHHPLAVADVVTPEALDNVPMITLYPDHAMFHDLSRLFANASSTLSVRLQTRFFIPALQFVERGLGACIVDPISISSYCARSSRGKVIFRRFLPSVTLKVGIIYPAHAPSSRITESFAEQLRDRLAVLERETEDFLVW